LLKVFWNEREVKGKGLENKGSKGKDGVAQCIVGKCTKKIEKRKQT